MKLTLRTLLAFLNETVSEDEAAALRKKIKESPAIRELIQRIRQVVSQPQLMAPRVLGKGLGADPNYAAEYIDNTLDLEQVAEFEKLTIGSDIFLAEIAEAHQILASLAEIDEGVSGRLRNRLYKATESVYKSDPDEPAMFPVVEDHASIQEEYDDVDASTKQKAKFVLAPPQQQPPRNDVESSQVARPPITAPPVVTQEDQLSIEQDDNSASEESLAPQRSAFTEGNSQLGPLEEAAKPATPLAAPPKSPAAKPVAAPQPRLIPVILATACVTALIVLLVISFVNRDPEQTANNGEDSEQSSKETQNTTNESQKTTNQSGGASSDSTSGDSATPENSKDGVGETNGEFKNDAAISPDAGNADLDSDQAVANAKNQNVNPRENGDAQTKIKQVTKLPTADANGVKNKQDQDADGQTEKKGDSDEIVNLFKDKDYTDQKGKGQPAAPENGQMPDKVADTKRAEKEVAPEKKLTDSKDLMAKAVSLVNGPSIGVMKTALEPTFRKPNLPDAKWIILAQEQPFYVNDSIFSLPDCRSQIEILESVRFYLYGLCELEIKANTGKVLPLVRVLRGITTLENLKEPNNTIDIQTQGKNFQVTFVDKTSKVTVVSHDNPPEKGAAPILQLVAEKGRAIIKFETEVKSLEENQMIVFSNAAYEIVPAKVKPTVMVKKQDTLTTSAKEIFFSLCLENPVFDVAVSKAISDSRPYLRKFVVEAALSRGRFAEWIEFLNEPENKSFWRETVLEFRQHVLSDRNLYQQAESFFGDFRSDDPDNAKQGEQLFRNLTVVTDQELIAGQDAQIVGDLESPALFVRVGAIQTLFALTGKTKFYRPEDKKDKRNKWVKAWEKSLTNEEVRISTPFHHHRFE